MVEEQSDQCQHYLPFHLHLCELFLYRKYYGQFVQILPDNSNIFGAQKCKTFTSNDLRYEKTCFLHMQNQSTDQLIRAFVFTA